jgi:probable HAF family extracellular repeat protein
MKSKIWTRIIALALFAALAIPVQLAAQSHKPNQPTRYQLIDLGTLGGNNSFFEPYGYCCVAVLSAQGAASVSSETSMPDPFPSYCFAADCMTVHEVVWKNGVLTDLGLLPGGASSAPQWISANGLIAGLSENGLTDPLAPGLPEFRATFWRSGTITDLGTLGGGYESVANAVNSRGQVVGQTTNTIPDPFSQAFDGILGVPYQTRAFVWQHGVMQDLGTLGGTDAAAYLINERGQIAGNSYISSTPNATGCEANVPAQHPFLWDKGKMTDLGSLGGNCAGISAINNQGQVAAGSTLPGDADFHAALWDNGTLTDLGTLPGNLGYTDGFTNWINERGAVVGAGYAPGAPGLYAALWKDGMMTVLASLPSYPFSNATFNNSIDQIVGEAWSTDFSTTTAILWQNGSVVDLNTMISPNSTLHLDAALEINDRGEIAVNGSDANGNTHAALLIPCGEGDGGVAGCDYSMVDASDVASRPSPAVSGASRRTLPQSLMRRMNRYRFPGLGAPPRN